MRGDHASSILFRRLDKTDLFGADSVGGRPLWSAERVGIVIMRLS